MKKNGEQGNGKFYFFQRNLWSECTYISSLTLGNS